jgi:undecaprenyl-diphosphatase
MTRWLVVVGRRLQPQARFFWNRLTPGGTFGLEFTTISAVLAVGLFVLVSYTVVISGDPGPTGGDMTAQDVADSIRSGWLTDVAKAFTHLGSGAFTWPLAVVCAAALAARRRWPELCVLLAGMLITIIGVHVIKDAVDRPRPAGGLVDSSGSSFPSGHAAYSVIYIWLAVTVVMRLRPGISRGTLIVASGIALSVLVGLSRVYLGVHYLSDVSAGWALGGSSFALCAAVALVATQLRDNPGRMTPPSEA